MSTVDFLFYFLFKLIIQSTLKKFVASKPKGGARKLQEEIKLIGRRIRLLRTAKNLTQTGLAKEMGISQTHLCNIECGRVPVTLPNLLKLHSLLECNMSSFFVDLDEQADAKDKDISLEEVLQIVKLLKQKG